MGWGGGWKSRGSLVIIKALKGSQFYFYSIRREFSTIRREFSAACCLPREKWTDSKDLEGYGVTLSKYSTSFIAKFGHMQKLTSKFFCSLNLAALSMQQIEFDQRKFEDRKYLRGSTKQRIFVIGISHT